MVLISRPNPLNEALKKNIPECFLLVELVWAVLNVHLNTNNYVCCCTIMRQNNYLGVTGENHLKAVSCMMKEGGAEAW
jgi:hypothetical protein